RRTVTAAREEAQATAADLRTVQLSLQAELARNYFALRSADAQQRLLDETVKAYTDTLQLATNRYKGGVDTYLQVLTAQTLTLTNERNAIDILRRRMDASVLLIKAIGGGWHVTDLPSLAQARRAPDS